MDLRQDALQGAAEMARAITQLVEAAGRPGVVTTGRWIVEPGAWNIVPGRVSFSIDLRHPNPTERERLITAADDQCRAIAGQRGLTVEIEDLQNVAERDLDPDLIRQAVASAEACGYTYQMMVSGAGHDSQVMATRVPTVMLFVPSVDGRSHSAAELTYPEDAARGATTLCHLLHRLAYDSGN